MENVSELLWHEMNRYIGVEEKVFITRKGYQLSEKFLFLDKHSNNDHYTRIISGSRVEGLELPGSDLDIMAKCDFISVIDNGRSLAQARDIIMDTNYIKPGFARLYCSSEVLQYLNIPLSNVTESRGCLLPLSSLLLRNKTVSDIKATTNSSAIAHGPCATFKTPIGIEIDFLICFSCKTWPKLASEWIHRNRKNNWPSNELVAEIVHGGCLVVPIGNQNSQETDMQWRISFSVAEKKLIHSFNHTQLLCYGFLKLYLKHVVNSNIDVKGLLCSYFLKTSLFYCIEEVHIVWKKETFLHCIFICIERIIKWVRDEYCPNYFIKDSNMFEGKICGDKGKKLLKYLCELYNDGPSRFCQIPCLSAFTAKKINQNMYTIFILTMGVTTNAEKELFCDLKLFSGLLGKPIITNLSQCIHNVVHISSLIEQSIDPIDKAILACSLPSLVFCLVQHMYHKVHSGDKQNKPHYRQIRALRNLIIKNCMTFDVCSGKLLLATICLLNGEYRKVKAITENVVKEILSSSVYEGHGQFICKKTRIDTLCGKGFTFKQKLARGFLAKSFECNLQCKCYPNEIEPELLLHDAWGMTFIPPIVYSRVLLFLTYHRLSSRKKMIDTLSKLYIAVQDDFFVNKLERPLAYSLLQKCIDLWETSQGLGFKTPSDVQYKAF